MKNYQYYKMQQQTIEKLTNNYTLTCCTPQHKLYTNLEPQSQTLSLLLYLNKSNTTAIYESVITQSNPLVQTLGSLKNVLDYLAEPSNICWEEGQEVMRVVSGISVKGVHREIQIGRIQFQLKHQPTHQDQQISISQIYQYCQSHKEISNRQLSTFLASIITHITNNQSKKVQQQYHELTQPLIKKIGLLGEGQQILKSKFSSISQQISQLNLTIAELNKQLSQKQKIIKDLIEDSKQNQMKVEELHKRIQTEVDDRIIQAKQFMYEKMKEVFREIDRNYEGIKQEIITQYKHQNRMKQQPRVQKFIAMNDEPAKHFQFSQVLKHSQIKLDNNFMVAHCSDDTRGKIALVNISVGSAKSKSLIEISIKFKIIKGPHTILVGACVLDAVREMGYKVQNWDRGQHGGYYLNSGQYVYSSYLEEDNATIKGFRYKEGDIIKITCSLQKKCLIFKKQNDKQSFMMQYDPILNEDRLYFAAILHGDDSKVQICK